MNIVLGSTSPQKLNILKRALEGKLAYWSIQGVEIISAVSELPLSIEETIQGATNRAKTALLQYPKADLAVGLVSGLEKLNGIYWLVCAAAFWDGQKLIVGQSRNFPLPLAVSDKVERGERLEGIIGEYRKTAQKSEQDRLDEIISHELSLASAINHAIPELTLRFGSGYMAKLWTQLASPLLVSGLLKSAAIFSAIFFGPGSVLMFLASFLGRHDVYQQITLLVPLFLFLWLVATFRMSTYSQFTSNSQLRQRLIWVKVATSLFVITSIWLVWLSWPHEYASVGMYARILIGFWIGVAFIVMALTLASYGYLFRHSQKLGYISKATQILLITGLVVIMLHGILAASFNGLPSFFTPILLLGLLWSYGLWKLSGELNAQEEAKIVSNQ